MTRLIVANCATPTDHTIHVGKPRPSMHQCVDGLEIRLCPGGRMGDKRVREYAGRMDDLFEIVRIEQVSAELAALMGDAPLDPSSLSVSRRHPQLSDATGLCDGPPEPDFDEDYEADRAADREERYRDSQW